MLARDLLEISVPTWLACLSAKFAACLVTLGIAVPLGLQLGIVLGHILFKWIFRAAKPKDYIALCDESRDDRDAIHTSPDVLKDVSMNGPVSFLKRRLLDDTSPALRLPDYDRVRFMNKILSQLWPHLSPAIHKEVMEQAKKPIEDAIKAVPVLGGRVLRNVRIDVLDLGTRPFRIDSFKSYISSPSDNWIMFEAPLLWGGDMRVRVVVELSCFGLFTVDVPIEVANIQIKALARITLYPLVEQLPCVGGVTLSLLEQPTVNLDLHILDSPDLLSLPPVPVVLRLVQNIVISKMLIYPNELSFPILPNYGLPMPPIGILRISVCYGINLKSSFLDEIDPFVRVELRNGRVRGTATLNNEQNPVWKDEQFDMVVDDLNTQKITVELYDDNFLTSPGLVGAVRIDLKEMHAAGLCEADESHRLLVPVFAPQSNSKKRNKRKSSYEVLGKKALREARDAAFVEDMVKEEVSKRPQAKLLIPYLMRKRAAKSARKIAMKEVEARVRQETVAEGLQETDSKSSGGVSSMMTGVADLAAISPLNTISKQIKKVALGERSIVGHICLETTFIPLMGSGEPGARGQGSDAGGGAPADAATTSTLTGTQTPQPLLKRMITFSSATQAADSYGILSIHIIKATQLSATTATYVELVCQEQGSFGISQHAGSVTKRISMATPHEYDPNPKFDYRADLNVRARSTLTLSVYEVGADVLRRQKVRRLGYTVINVLDVVEVGHCREAHSLIGAEAGELHVACEWLSL